MILNFDTPQKVFKRGESGVVIDGGPIDGFTKNMSHEDARKWNAKIFNRGKSDARVEIRKRIDIGGTDIVIIVSLGNGYTYGNRKPINTKGINVHISANGAMTMTFSETNEMFLAIEEAKAALYAIP